MSSNGFAALHPAVQYHLANTLRWSGLRSLQDAAVEPVLAGRDCLLLAPTAGGKTEAAVLPLLTRMADEGWRDVSVLYICPLRALLNNLAPRLTAYTGWLGRSAALWHGDVARGERARIVRERPDILLTTPESIEAILVSSTVEHRVLFSGLRAVVIDEVHAFAGDDRGWHLLALLERLERVLGRPLQRVGLSATVGNPDELAAWLQGAHDDRPRQVVAPEAETSSTPEITLDHVGSIANAAKVIASLHNGEKRLVFVDSRKQAEELGVALHGLGVRTFLSHSSLSATERRRSEEEFADARDTVFVATSTLELGVDVGDLDRVIQLDAPRTVASFLQRLGRTGRRPGSTRNCLFLCLSEDALLRAAGLMERWAAGWVEPIIPPPKPLHIAAQQLMALCLQEHRIGARTWREQWNGLSLLDKYADEIIEHLRTTGFFEQDGDFLFIGQEAERRFGHRYFAELTSVFSAAPQFTVRHGRRDLGTIGDDLLTQYVDGPRVLLLAGRSWQVTHIDWARRQCWVEQSELPGRAKWGTAGGTSGFSFEITRGMRAVLLGATPSGVTTTKRADSALANLRETHHGHVDRHATLIRRYTDGTAYWWTWAGTAVNRTLQASLPGIVDQSQRLNDESLRLNPDLTVEQISTAMRTARAVAPAINQHAAKGLKFTAALPEKLAQLTLETRLAKKISAQKILTEPHRFSFG